MAPCLFSFFNHVIALFFSRYFDCVDVCKIRDDWTEARVASVLPPFAGGPNEVVSITVFSPTELDLCVYQKTSRLATVCVQIFFNNSPRLYVRVNLFATLPSFSTQIYIVGKIVFPLYIRIVILKYFIT